MHVKEFKTCPVCGHHGWCGKRDSLTSKVPGAELYYCHYIHELNGAVGSTVVGVDGVAYYVISKNKNGDGYILETEEQRQEENRIWREQNPGSNTYSNCPVCGRSDCCYWFTPKNSNVPNAQIIVCKSVTNGSKGNSLRGQDGVWYRMIKPNENGGFMLETSEQHRESTKRWREGKNRENEKSSFHQDPPQNDSTMQKKERVAHAQSGTKAVIDYPRAGVTAQTASKLRSNAELDRVYQVVINNLHLLPSHREKLKEDGWTDDLIKQYQIVSMPLPDKERWEIEQRCKNGDRRPEALALPWRHALVEAVQKEIGKDLSGVPGFYEMETKDKFTGEGMKKWKMAGPSGMMFFSRDIKGHIFGCQIRLDKVTGKGKYRAWSTNPDMTDKYGRQMYPNGTSLPGQAGFIYNPERDQSYIAYVTEGHKKGVIGNHILKCPFITLDGVGKYSLILNNPDPSLNIVEYLRRIGVQTIIIAYDADKAVNNNVLYHEQGVAEMFKSLGFQIKLADWHLLKDRCKGLDDLLITGVYPDFTDV